VGLRITQVQGEIQISYSCVSIGKTADYPLVRNIDILIYHTCINK
jgi:hypothetical protein